MTYFDTLHKYSTIAPRADYISEIKHRTDKCDLTEKREAEKNNKKNKRKSWNKAKTINSPPALFSCDGWGTWDPSNCQHQCRISHTHSLLTKVKIGKLLHVLKRNVDKALRSSYWWARILMQAVVCHM
jgi:hypothetical protein